MRILLILLTLFTGITALAGGLMLMLWPDGSAMQLPLGQLNAPLFSNYLIPGVILFFVVGGMNMAALVAILRKKQGRYNLSMVAGVMIIGFIIGELLFVSELHWLQFLYLGIGLLTVLTAYQLKGKWAV